jgi:ComF family protein
MRTFNTNHLFKPWLISLSNLIFPPLCSGCKNPLSSDEKWLCLSCETKLPVAPYLLQNDNPIKALLNERLKLHFSSSFLLFTKNGIAQKLIHELKYKDNTRVGEELGFMFGKALKGQIETPDAIIPIPLHPKKEKLRGYNQSYFIAKGLAKSLQTAVDETLVKRVKENQSQTSLSRFDRWENVKDIFLCERSSDYKYIWLIDDTLTTGSTIESCANAILKKNDVKLGIATLAFAY